MHAKGIGDLVLSTNAMTDAKVMGQKEAFFSTVGQRKLIRLARNARALRLRRDKMK